MCGICGIVDLDSVAIEPAMIGKMTSAISHRGPDGEGYLLVSRDGAATALSGPDTPSVLGLPPLEQYSASAPSLAFGHRRLSIIDLSSAGHQPMSYANGRYWITYNGEIYNYIELRSDLASLGYTFSSDTDTEVILAAYDRWGKDALRHLNGMFAFALWDNAEQILFCARDRLGIKPFYYCFDGRALYFASEIKAILAVLPVAAQVNVPYLADFLVTGRLDYGEQTFFESVRALPPAHFLALGLGDGSLSVARYWDIDPELSRAAYDYGHAEETFVDLLDDAVSIHMRSDVPVGTCLSGGIDSSSIVSLASRMLPHPMHSFSSVYPLPGYSEEAHIKTVVRDSKTIAHYTTPEPINFLNLFRRIICQMDEPVAGAGVFSQWFVMEEASQHVKVLLDGQGGDELFAGYFSYLVPHLKGLARQVLLRRNLSMAGRLAGDSLDIARRARPYFFPQLTLQQFAGRVASHVTGRRDRADFFLSPAMGSRRAHFRDGLHIAPGIKEPLEQALYLDVTQLSIPALLHYEDRNSMAFGLEARVPLLDYRIVEFAFGLPDSEKIRGSMTKHFMRESLKGILPESVRLRRDKMGYPTPMAVWLRGPLQGDVEAALIAHWEGRGYYNLQTVQQMWQDHLSGRADHSWHITRWLATELWLQEYID